MDPQLLDRIESYWDEMTALRHALHEHPETSGQEVETSARLQAECEKLGLPVEVVPKTHRSHGTGFIATLDTGRSGPTLGLRTDIDALPVQESDMNLSEKRTVRSKNPGVMHACGHDGHMATLVTAMKILVDLKEHLTGKVIFIFEEGEEIGTGIEAMVEFLKSRGLDAVYGNHLRSTLPLGEMDVSAGPVMAACTIIDFEVIGKGGHGSRPDLSRNPVFAGADILNSLSTVWNNQIDVNEVVTLGLTQFNAGTQMNVFPERAHIGGSLRFFNQKEGEKAYDLLLDTARQVAAVHQCRVEEGPSGGPITYPVINDAELVSEVQLAGEEIFPGQMLDTGRGFGSETFAHYGQLAPSVFTFIGTENKARGIGAAHHHEAFDIDDEALRYSTGLMLQFAWNKLHPSVAD